jgi:hypothetical protein
MTTATDASCALTMQRLLRALQEIAYSLIGDDRKPR